jgi:hypothetical protein
VAYYFACATFKRHEQAKMSRLLQVSPGAQGGKILLSFAVESLILFLRVTLMSDETKERLSANDLLKNSSLYREFQAEREEILKHKWIESEKAGRDIGFERALTDWIIKHRSKWRRGRQATLSR